MLLLRYSIYSFICCLFCVFILRIAFGNEFIMLPCPFRRALSPQQQQQQSNACARKETAIVDVCVALTGGEGKRAI